MRWWWLVLLVVAAVSGKGKKQKHHKPGRALLDRLSSTTVGEVFVTSGADEGLLPAPLDVAPYSLLEANATCGENGAEEYCRDTPGKRGVVCDVCEGPEGSPSRRHPAAHAVDGDHATWWQSPTLPAAEQHVALVATLPAEMDLMHVIIKSGPSPRPLAWSVEVSAGDADWRLVRAFGDKDHCKKLWDLRPERRRRKARGVKRTSRADKPTCSTQFASPKPMENGEMHVALGGGVRARYVRVSLRAAHGRGYYSVRALTLAARCRCHGHATRCQVTTESAECVCLHGTCGAHCDRCCSQSAWAPHTPCADDTFDVPPAEPSRAYTGEDDLYAKAGGEVGQELGEGGCCGERGACVKDELGDLLCVNCTENRAGPLCEHCLPGYYSIALAQPCIPCNCDPEGSDGTCTWDRSKHAVTCSCRVGRAGGTCSQRCDCDPQGTLRFSDDCSEGCVCKENVVGSRCDACAVGHFMSRGACVACHCAGATCRADPTPGVEEIFPLDESWVVMDGEGQETLEASVDQEGKPLLISYEVEGWDSFYWVPPWWTGEKFGSYGGDIHVNVGYGVVRGDAGGTPTNGPDFVIIAKDGTRLTTVNTTHASPGELDLMVPLREGYWYLGDQLVTRSQLLDVLINVKLLMIRAQFHADQDEVRLSGVQVGGSTPYSREICECAPGRGGAGCGACATRHVRAPGGDCVPCPCNNHAECTHVDGPCGECQHNTTGENCERCLPGYYGNPVQGGCKPCACPLYLSSNNFSPNCALADAEGDEYVCTQCPPGYTGDHCESCDFGYWGSPLTPGGRCVACACGGAPCDAAGACVTCAPYTEGVRCDQCQEGYWFGPSLTTVGPAGCVPCACGRGALAAACSARGGACACQPRFSGRTCDECAEGYGDVSAGCPACQCGVAAVDSVCDTLTGACTCTPGAAPPYCDRCLEQHYDLQASGCQGCNCSTLGSESGVCDIRSGQCRCKPHVTGRACDICEEGYWGLDKGGCRRCSCGAGAAACEPHTGQCACAVGVGGDRCDRCLSGYYGLGPNGCLPCPVCTDGKICSATTGRCVCPAGARGAGCRSCAPGHWLHDRACRPCRCGPGAVSHLCSGQSGQCKCRVGWSGVKCDVCDVGYFGARCKPCHCSRAGARNCERTDTPCPCDEHGRCQCKENVEGDKCDRCLDGTFGLSADNTVGCTACFCFGRSTRCSEARLARARHHAMRTTHLTLLQGERVTTMDQDSLLAIHTHARDATITLPYPPVPVYIELDRGFLGDRVTSYGGSLRFHVEEEGGDPLDEEFLAKFPLVRLYGQNIVMDYYERIPPTNNTHSVRLHESLWAVRGMSPPAPAPRAALMFALSHVTRILVRVTTSKPRMNHPLHALLLNVSLDTTAAGLARVAMAGGLELCECPRGYSAESCHKPDVGFWMPNQRAHISNVAGTIVISVEGEAEACQCGGRATHCHPATGHCQNCTDNTTGPRCNVCAEGYFGTPESHAGCRPCACPAAEHNHASSCTERQGRMLCRCKPGYTGALCSTCSPGYYRLASACVSCACDPRGAASAACDQRGRCTCRDHAAGDKCDRCRDVRMQLQNNGCSPCDNCTQTLLDSMQRLTLNLHQQADLTELNRLPQPFPAVREYHRNQTILATELDKLKHSLVRSSSIQKLLGDLEAKQHQVFTEANRLKQESSKRSREAESLSLESMSALEEVLKQREKIGGEVERLEDFARGEGHLSAHRALKEARRLLQAVKEVKFNDLVAGVNDVFETANLQSTSIQELLYKLVTLHSRVPLAQAALDRWEHGADDVQDQAAVVWRASDEVDAARARYGNVIPRVKDRALACRMLEQDIATISSSARNLTSSVPLPTLNLQPMIKELGFLTSQAEEKEGILYNLTPVYREKYMDTVEKHVAKLGEKATEYKNLFAGTRALASSGVAAARAWSDVSTAVTDASTAAVSAASAVRVLQHMARGQNNIVLTADTFNNKSTELIKRAEEVFAKSAASSRAAQDSMRGLELVRLSLREVSWAERALSARPRSAVRPALASAARAADRVFAHARRLHEEAADMRRAGTYALRRQLADLRKHGDTALGAAQEHVSQISSMTERGAQTATALTHAADARAREQAAGGARVAPALQALRDNVLRARHAADSISVSVRSGAAGCSRGYTVSGGGGAVTRVSLFVSFDHQLQDGPLVYLHEPAIHGRDKYMKLYLENHKLCMSWDLGAGEGRIRHPDVLVPTHDDSDHTSYRIEIERIWNTVRLTSERSNGQAVSSTNSSSPSRVSLRAQRAWLGEPHGSLGLPACVHSFNIDGNRIGLWNFAEQPKEAQCTGCTQRMNRPGRGGDASMVWFNGGGYVALTRSGLRPSDARQFSISFTFRTRDENALLFMARDVANNRSVSVWLSACRVELRVRYHGAVLRLAAPRDVCRDKHVHVQAIRVFAGNQLERGSLRVNGQETLGSPSPPVQSASALPDLSSASYYVGGVPPGAGADLGEANEGLLGCVGSLTVDREGYDLMDTPTRHGVEPGCGTRTLRSAVFEGKGYIELPSPTIRRKAAVGVGLSFRARAGTGVLLYRAPSTPDNEVLDSHEDDQHYLALVLVDGNLELLAMAGKGDMHLKANASKYGDGHLHTVRITRAHKQVELWVDEQKVASGVLPGNAFRAREGGLYLGGTGPQGKGGPNLPKEGFTGTIADFIVDSNLIGLESLVHSVEARVGRADIGPPPAAAPPPALRDTPRDTHCTKSPSYAVEAGAVKFGDAPYSHASIKLPPRAKELDVALHFRTFAKDGLLLLIPGSKMKPKHYVALLIKDGKLRLVVRARRKKEISLTSTVNDGVWRSVVVRMSRARVLLESEGAARSTAGGGGGAAGGRGSRLYVGGAPPPHTLPHLPHAVLSWRGLVGCVRHVSVNSRASDLPRHQHRAGQCYPAVQQGAYFPGDAYAVWSESWGAAGAGGGGTSREVRLQFRSTEHSGLLLAGNGMLLEMNDGNIILSVEQGSEWVQVEATQSQSLCDGEWHAVWARAGGSVRGALAVDAPLTPPPSAPALSDGETRSTPVYIAGLPEDSPDFPHGRENFKGCIRDVIIGGQKKEWTNMDALHNVLLDSCPVAQ